MKYIIILGPTCTGKTSAALSLCHQFNGEIVSADSRQIYKYMDIGTGKVSSNLKGTDVQKMDGVWKVNNIPIYMYDVVTPNVNYSVFDYAKKATSEIESIIRRGKVPFVVGGTGFYINVISGMQKLSGIPPNNTLRSELNIKDLSELQEIFKKIDASKYNQIDINNKVRLIRAIEIAKSPLPNETKNISESADDILFIGLTAVRKVLYENADKWVKQIIGDGIILEVKKLIELGYANTPAVKGIIYSTVLEYIRGNLSLEKMQEQMCFDMHDYIRRQLTWFSRNENVEWFNVQEKGFDTKVLNRVQLFIDGR